MPSKRVVTFWLDMGARISVLLQETVVVLVRVARTVKIADGV
jgi:hypothetical protein